MISELCDTYDRLVYSPLKPALRAVAVLLPHWIDANWITYARTCLVVPICWCVASPGYGWLAAVLVATHDLLDHFDGVVAQYHCEIYGPPSAKDQVYGAWLDAFCDKCVNGLVFWVMFFSRPLVLAQRMGIVGVLWMESRLGFFGVQGYFDRMNALKQSPQQDFTSGDGSIDEQQERDWTQGLKATMPGKLKEKLETMAMILLCLEASQTGMLMLVSSVLLALTIALADASLSEHLTGHPAKCANCRPIVD